MVANMKRLPQLKKWNGNGSSESKHFIFDCIVSKSYNVQHLVSFVLYFSNILKKCDSLLSLYVALILSVFSLSFLRECLVFCLLQYNCAFVYHLIIFTLFAHFIFFWHNWHQTPPSEWSGFHVAQLLFLGWVYLMDGNPLMHHQPYHVITAALCKSTLLVNTSYNTAAHTV